MSLRTTLLAVLAALLALPGAAMARGPIDQQQPTEDGSITMPPGIAQTFTVGQTGTLDGLTLYSPTYGRISYQLYGVNADGTPDVNRPYLATPQQASFLLGTPAEIALPSLPVSAGDRIALAIGTIRSTDTMQLGTAAGDPYPAGDLFTVSGYWTFTPVAADLRFTTYVTPGPAVTQLTVAGLAAGGGRPTATLTAGTARAPVAGRSVRFDLLRSNGSVKSSCTATTGADGVAACAKVRWSMPSGGSLRGQFAGDADYLPSTGSVTS